MTIYGYDRIKKISKKFSLPNWWIEAVIVEYFDCRRYAEEGGLWIFDFNKINVEEINTIPEKKVVITNYYLLQNIQPVDFSKRASLLMIGLPVIPLEEADLIPEGLVNNSGFPSPITNNISVWDPKLDFNQRAIVCDDHSFYQWTVAEPYDLPGQNYRWYRSDLFDLSNLLYIVQKLLAYRNSGELKHPGPELPSRIAQDYQRLEQVRDPLRKKILELHYRQKVNYDKSQALVSEPPILSIFEAVKLTKDGYYVKTHMEPLFLRSAIRNYLRAKAAKEIRNKNAHNHESLLDEIEYSAMCIISATNCLESYVNYIISKYLPKESKIFDDTTSHRQKWLWVPYALNLPYKFKVDEPPFRDFSNLVKWRNNVIHHKPNYTRARGIISHTANQFNSDNAQLAIKIVKEMISKLSEKSSIPLPRWIATDMGSAEYWDEVSSYLKQIRQ